jgi:hypothetical protein
MRRLYSNTLIFQWLILAFDTKSCTSQITRYEPMPTRRPTNAALAPYPNVRPTTTLSRTPLPTIPATKFPTNKPTLSPTPQPTFFPSMTPVTETPISYYGPSTPVSSPESSTVGQLLLSIESSIGQAIINNPLLAATFLRLGFHDCVPNGDAGGCDGCINLSNPSNFGLRPAIDALSSIVEEFENPEVGISRADIWAYAVLIAAEVSQIDITFMDEFQIGRKNCETVGTCDASITDCAVDGPDQISDFPTADFTTHQLITFMSDHFNFNSDQTVAIMGAHTMGRALPNNSGYRGRNGWVFNPLSLGTNFINDIFLNVL